jgi:hypothetical protein
MDAAYIIKSIKEMNDKLVTKNGKIEKFSMNSDQFLSFGALFSILIGGYAAYLSYSCNSKHNMSEPMKIIWAIISYMFGFIYLIYYALFRSDYCS